MFFWFEKCKLPKEKEKVFPSLRVFLELLNCFSCVLTVRLEETTPNKVVLDWGIKDCWLLPSHTTLQIPNSQWATGSSECTLFLSTVRVEKDDCSVYVCDHFLSQISIKLSIAVATLKTYKWHSYFFVTWNTSVFLLCGEIEDQLFPTVYGLFFLSCCPVPIFSYTWHLAQQCVSKDQLFLQAVPCVLFPPKVWFS